MKHSIIGTAGHVDHGKSSLIQALTGLEMDRLSEEKKRGITIELGFAYLDLPDGSKAGIIDVPGHERFVHSMLAGAGGIDLALLVIAADEGVMPQTEEHLDILRLLDVKHGIVVLTKSDLVEIEWLDFVEEMVRESIAGSFFASAPVYRVSAYTGEGIEALRQEIFRTLEALPDKDETLDFRQPIDRVFSIEGFGTVVTGTIFEGHVRVGDSLMLYPQEQEVRVRNIQVHDTNVEVAYSGQRTAINLAQVSLAEVDRGQVLAAKGSLDPSRLLDVSISVSPQAEFPIKNRSHLHFHYGAAKAVCQIRLFDREEVKAGEETVARLLFEEDVALKYNDPFVLRFFSPLVTLGGGHVLDPHPRTLKVKNTVWQERLELLQGASEQQRLLLALDSASPYFSSLDQALRRSGLSMLSREGRASLLDPLLAAKELYQLQEDIFLSRHYLDKLEQDACRILGKFHQQYPLKAGMKKEALRTSLRSDVKLEYLDKIIDLFIAEGKLRLHNGLVSLPDFTLVLSPEQEAAQAKMLKIYKESGFTPPDSEELIARFDTKLKPAELLSNLIDRGELIRLDEKLSIDPAYMEKSRNFIIKAIEQEGSLKLADFRDFSQSSRKYAVAILEYFDRAKLTRLQGDVRILL